MNPEGMVALLNYREDGITRMYFPLCKTDLDGLPVSNSSLFHLLEARSQAGQVVIVPRQMYSFVFGGLLS